MKADGSIVLDESQRAFGNTEVLSLMRTIRNVWPHLVDQHDDQEMNRLLEQALIFRALREERSQG